MKEKQRQQLISIAGENAVSVPDSPSLRRAIKSKWADGNICYLTINRAIVMGAFNFQASKINGITAQWPEEYFDKEYRVHHGLDAPEGC